MPRLRSENLHIHTCKKTSSSKPKRARTDTDIYFLFSLPIPVDDWYDTRTIREERSLIERASLFAEGVCGYIDVENKEAR